MRTEMRFEQNRRRPSVDAAGSRAEGERPDRSRRLRALLVDDDPRILRAYAHLLGAAGVECELATGGFHAQKLLAEQQFDVVVSDILMPGMDGVELLRQIRARKLDVPVILMTGDPSIESAANAVDHGAVRYMFKPVDADDLVDAIREAARAPRDSDPSSSSISESQEAGSENQEAGGEDESGPSGVNPALRASFDRAISSLWIAYQPIVSWRERCVVAYEALCRSREPEFPHPGALLDAAERLGRIHELGRRIREEALKACAVMPDEVSLFINLHPQDLLDDALAAGTPHASRVVLEITERAALDGVVDVEARIDSLKAAGFRIAVDDLGAGYAGLTTFVKLTPSVVKLDMSLVRDIDQDPRKVQIVQGLVDLCAGLGAGLVVEGVETVAERDTLAACGCDWMQGYLFGRPAAELAKPDL